MSEPAEDTQQRRGRRSGGRAGNRQRAGTAAIHQMPWTIPENRDRAIEPLDAEEKTAGGILLPDSAKQKPQRGRVVATGPGKLSEKGERLALAVAKGDEVFYGKYSGSDVEVSGRELKILRESDILAKVVK